MSAPLTIAQLTWRQLFARRRVLIAIAIAVIPFLLTFLYRFMSEDREGDRLGYFMGTNRELLFSVLAPLTAVIFATTAFGGEIEDGTLIYLLAKPVPRWQVVAIKYGVALLVTLMVGFVGVLLPWFALRNAELPGALARGMLFGVVVSAVVYCALFTWVGLKTRRGLLFGLLYIIFFENVMSRNFDGIKSLSARELSLSAAQWASAGTLKWTEPGVEMSTVWWVGSIILVVSMFLAMRGLTRYELAERL